MAWIPTAAAQAVMTRAWSVEISPPASAWAVAGSSSRRVAISSRADGSQRTDGHTPGGRQAERRPAAGRRAGRAGAAEAQLGRAAPGRRPQAAPLAAGPRRDAPL